MKKILTALLLVVFLFTPLDAQDFESYKKMQQEAFQAHKNKSQENWDAYRCKANANFAEYLKRS